MTKFKTENTPTKNISNLDKPLPSQRFGGCSRDGLGENASKANPDPKGILNGLTKRVEPLSHRGQDITLLAAVMVSIKKSRI